MGFAGTAPPILGSCMLRLLASTPEVLALKSACTTIYNVHLTWLVPGGASQVAVLVVSVLLAQVPEYQGRDRAQEWLQG